MPVIKGTQSITPIYKGSDKIGKIYKGLDLVYQSVVYNPVVALIEKTIEEVDEELFGDITTIGTYAFHNCTSLKKVIIPSTVTSIGLNAFEGCTSLTEMTILATTPPTLEGVNATGAISYSTSIIYVPSESLELYQTDSSWSGFMTRPGGEITFVGI